jgi:hypothetical protein
MVAGRRAAGKGTRVGGVVDRWCGRWCVGATTCAKSPVVPKQLVPKQLVPKQLVPKQRTKQNQTIKQLILEPPSPPRLISKRRTKQAKNTLCKFSLSLPAICFVSDGDAGSPLPIRQVGTRYKLNGEYLPGSPADADCLEDIEVEYDTFEGWNSCTENIRDGRDLPQRAKDYIACVATNARPPHTPARGSVPAMGSLRGLDLCSCSVGLGVGVLHGTINAAMRHCGHGAGTHAFA